MIKKFRLEKSKCGNVSLFIGDGDFVEEADCEYSVNHDEHDMILFNQFWKWAGCEGYLLEDLQLIPFRVGDFLFTPERIVRERDVRAWQNGSIYISDVNEFVIGKVERFAGVKGLQEALDEYKTQSKFP